MASRGFRMAKNPLALGAVGVGLTGTVAYNLMKEKKVEEIEPRQKGGSIKFGKSYLVGEDGPEVFINPRILWRSFSREIGEEGCLSIPGIYGLVKRPKSVIILYTDRTGHSRRLRAKGLMARVICHENDHINGVLFTDKMIKQTAGDNSDGNA